jgi:hypothetical protein
MGTIFSAEIVAPSTRHGRRVKITNRHTGEKYYRPYPVRSEQIEVAVARGDALAAKVRDLHTSPFLIVNRLWYDEALDMYFFEVNRRT